MCVCVRMYMYIPKCTSRCTYLFFSLLSREVLYIFYLSLGGNFLAVYLLYFPWYLLFSIGFHIFRTSFVRNLGEKAAYEGMRNRTVFESVFTSGYLVWW